MLKPEFQYAATIIEDEYAEAEYLKHIIAEYNPELTVTDVFRNPVEASKVLAEKTPDFVFVDLEMPQMNGMEIAKLALSNGCSGVVLVTGHKEYALQALNLGIRHYLLKPFKPSDIRNVVLQVLEEKIKKNPTVSLFNNKLYVRKHEKIHILNLEDIIYIEAEGSYALIHLRNNSIIKSSKRLGTYKTMLEDLPNFYELSRSLVINVSHISEVEKYKNHGVLVMSSGKRIKLSQQLTASVSQLLERLIWRS